MGSNNPVYKNDLTNKSIQTSNILEVNSKLDIKKKLEWQENKNLERQGLPSNNFRVINKDPSIYDKNSPSLVEKGPERFRPSNQQNSFPQIKNLKLEEESKQKQDEIRQRNIERAMRELEASRLKSIAMSTDKEIDQHKSDKKDFEQNHNNSSLLYKVEDPDYFDQMENAKYVKTNMNGKNFYINNSKEVRQQQIMPDPEDIDDLVDTSKDHVNSQIRNQVNVSGLSQKISITEDIENAYDKMQKFERMHKFS